MNCSREQLVSDPAITCVALSGPMADGSHPTQQQAVALYVAVDRSGSMASANKLDNVKLSLDQLLTYLNGGDFFTVLAFDHLVNTTVDCEDCSPDHKVIMQQRLGALRPGGSTHLEAAIKA
jgi:secreted protein with Ig-like and vWFA domain